MKKKGALLGSVLAVTVSSAPTLAADFNTPAGSQGTGPSALQNAVLGAKEFGPECESVDNSTAATWNVGEFCLFSDPSTSTTGFAESAVVNDAAVAASPLHGSRLETAAHLVNHAVPRVPVRQRGRNACRLAARPRLPGMTEGFA
jgi:hypothetical protein